MLMRGSIAKTRFRREQCLDSDASVRFDVMAARSPQRKQCLGANAVDDMPPATMQTQRLPGGSNVFRC